MQQHMLLTLKMSAKIWTSSRKLQTKDATSDSSRDNPTSNGQQLKPPYRCLPLNSKRQYQVTIIWFGEFWITQADEPMRDLRVISTGPGTNWEFGLSMYGLNEGPPVYSLPCSCLDESRFRQFEEFYRITLPFVLGQGTGDFCKSDCFFSRSRFSIHW